MPEINKTIEVLERLQKMYASQILCEYSFFKKRAEALTHALTILKELPSVLELKDIQNTTCVECEQETDICTLTCSIIAHAISKRIKEKE